MSYPGYPGAGAGTGGGYPNYPSSGGGGYPSYPPAAGGGLGGGYPVYSPPGGGGGYPAPASQPRREFHITSELNGKVVDIKQGTLTPGVDVVVYRKHSPPTKNQLWYLDSQLGCIKSALNDMGFHNDTKGHGLKTIVYSGNPRSCWRMEGNKIVNGVGECLDIKGGKNSNGAEVCAYDYKDQKNQHWTLEYI